MLIHKQCLTPVVTSEEAIGFVNDFEEGKVELIGFHCPQCKVDVEDDRDLEVVNGAV